MMNQLKIASFNMQTFSRGKEYLVQCIARDCNIICLSEHGLYECQFYRMRECLKDFNTSLIKQSSDLNPDTYSSIRGHCGTALIWKEALDKCIKPITTIKSDRICGIQVETGKNGLLTVVSVYMPQANCKIAEYDNVLHELDEVAEHYSQVGHVLIMGDVNAHIGPEGGPRGWGKTTPSGHKLLHWVKESALQLYDMQDCCHGPRYTFKKKGRENKSYIDHCIVTGSLVPYIRQCRVWEPEDRNISDHLPLSIVLDTKNLPQLNYMDTPVKKLKWDKVTEEDLIRDYVEPLSATLENISQSYNMAELVENGFGNKTTAENTINAIVGEITTAINDAADNAIPRSKYRKHLKAYWTPLLTELSQVKDEKWKEWNEAGRPRGENSETWSKLKEAKRVFRQERRRREREYDRRVEDEVNEEDSIDLMFFWNLVRKARKQPKKRCGPIRDDEGTLVTEPEDIRGAWRQHFQRLACEERDDKGFDREFKAQVEEKIKEIEAGDLEWESTLLATPFSEAEMVKACGKMKNRKAPGWDMITAEHVKKGGPIVIKILTMMYNLITKTRLVPAHFKKGVRIPLFKGGNKDPEMRDNHRGITLLPVLSKLYETLILGRTEEWFWSNVNIRQCAGQKGGSSLHCATILQETIAHVRNGGSTAYVALLDAKKAFDSVWIDGLFYQLFQKRMDYSLWRIIRAYYTDSQCCVRVAGGCSDWFQVRVGVHQGGVLSMKLYQIYIDSLLDLITSEGEMLMIGHNNCNILAYADDVALVSLTPDALQRNLDLVYEHSRKWQYQHNTSKSEVLVMTEQNDANGKGIQFTLGNGSIPQVDYTSHMGVVLGKSPKYMEDRIMKGKKATRAIMSLASSGKIVSPQVSSRLYWSITAKTTLYGVEVMDVSSPEICKLEAEHRKAAKSLQGLPQTTPSPAVLATNGWVYLEVYIDILRAMFLWRLLTSKTSSLCKTMALKSMVECINGGLSKNHTSPLIRLYRTWEKYGIEGLITEMITTGQGPPQATVRKRVKGVIMAAGHRKWRVECHLYESLTLYRQVVTKVEPCIWWKVADDSSKLRTPCRSVVTALTNWRRPVVVKDPLAEDNTCQECNQGGPDTYCHLVTQCEAYKPEREKILAITEGCSSGNVTWDLIMSGMEGDGGDRVIQGDIALTIHSMVEKKISQYEACR